MYSISSVQFLMNFEVIYTVVNLTVIIIARWLHVIMLKEHIALNWRSCNQCNTLLGIGYGRDESLDMLVHKNS